MSYAPTDEMKTLYSSRPEPTTEEEIEAEARRDDYIMARLVGADPETSAESGFVADAQDVEIAPDEKRTLRFVLLGVILAAVLVTAEHFL